MSTNGQQTQNNESQPSSPPPPPKVAAGTDRPVSPAQDVAMLVMARVNLINSKKDELTLAIKSLSDLTQQLATAYVKQTETMAQLTRRVKALESGGTWQEKAAADRKRAEAKGAHNA